MSHARPVERAACRELEPGATLERALDFAAHWRLLGGDAIALDDFCANEGCEPLRFVQLPAWAEAIGALFAPKRARSLVWVMPKTLTAAGDGVLQLAIQRSKSWRRSPALVRYAGIGSARDNVSGGTLEQRFSGIERVSGEPIVLTLPARGESLILIAESF